MADLTVTAAQVAYVMDTIPLRRSYTAGAALTAGQVFAYDPSTKKVVLADADSATLTLMEVVALAMRSCAANAPITGIKQGAIYGVDLSGMSAGAKVYLSATPGGLSDTDPGADEVQTVTLNGSPTGGTFTLTYNAVTSGNIAYNASAATVQAALEAMSSIGPGNVNVTGSAGGPYTITFINRLGRKNLAALTSSAANLTGGTPSIAHAQVTAGVASIVIGRVETLNDDQMTKVLWVDIRP